LALALRAVVSSSLGNKLIAAANDTAAVSCLVMQRQRLRGVLNYYHRAAA
jgi:hypothetical protein